MEQRIIISGFGGQGVQSIGQMITYAGMLEGHNVSLLPSYGPEMRGGTTSCMVILSDEPIGAPIIDEATCCMVLNPPSFTKYEPAVEKGGCLFVNSSLVDAKTSREDIKAYYIPCNEMALELGNARVGNMIMLGAFMKLTGCISMDNVLAALRKVLGAKKENLVEVNRKALELGMTLA